MIGYFYDDYLHIGQACHRASELPGYRTIITNLYCSFGDYPWVLRSFSLICIGLSLLVTYQVFSKWEAINFNKFHVGLAFHPVLYFPIFYTSQLSTSLTFLWAVLLNYFIHTNKNIILLITTVLVGLGLRYEAIYFFLVSFIAFGVIKGLNLNQVNPFIVFDKKTWKKFSSVVFIFFTASFVFSSYFKGASQQTSILNVYSHANESYYPASSHFFTQIYASLIYLKNLFLPFDASFYYPWSHWMNIHNSIPLQLSLISAFVLLVIAPLVYFFSKYIYNKSIHIQAILIPMFISICLVFSARTRFDWYFQSRQYVATFFFLFLLIILIEKLKYKKYIFHFLSLYFISSLAVQYWGHYKSEQVFKEWEFSRFKYTSPPASNLKALTFPELVQQKIHYNNYKLIDETFLNNSVVAKKFWLQALFSGYIVSRNLNDTNSMNGIYKEISRSNSYYSTLVCLLHHQGTDQSCLEGNRKDNFCSAIRSKKVLEIELLKGQIDLSSICTNY